MITQQTLDFITEIKENNNREWFLDNKDKYQLAYDNIVQFTGDVLKELSKIDPLVDAHTDPKKCIMRIYRDIRFSKDKTPYKHWIGIHKLSQGRYAAGIGYYMHIEPGNSFVGGGYWMPEGEHVKMIRQEIDYNATDFKAIVDKSSFKKTFGEFRDQEQLKTIPNGYDADNENISLLKLKSFAAVHQLKDAELKKIDIAKNVAGVFKELYPLLGFLQNALV
ncbi:DUF2461 domain-containing protein [Mucilaginibacter mali]|uniref:DUF2461 domain-containing protein n=1 Tax=Mucilaginibacter mali TaxID=2740462 RepID=A0A7D4UE34_9SPHI|nr:DUF2461 domain-containing protein [Mucilaginibacter mali]QKJ31159.1 DUF2461 domain-containing protein [Mucilaginibacter mali]